MLGWLSVTDQQEDQHPPADVGVLANILLVSGINLKIYYDFTSLSHWLLAGRNSSRETNLSSNLFFLFLYLQQPYIFLACAERGGL